MRRISIKDRVGKISRIIHKKVNFLESDHKVEDLFAPLSSVPGSVLFLSGGSSDCCRYSFVGYDPFIIVTAVGNRIELRTRTGILRFWANPFDVVQEIMDFLSMSPINTPIPFYAGAMGYWGYDLRYHLEKLPDLAKEDLKIPDLYLVFPSIILVLDREEKEYWITVLETDGRNKRKDTFLESINRFRSVLDGYEDSLSKLPRPKSIGQYSTNFTREAYIAAIERTRDYIRRGHIYQVNISQRFAFPFIGSDYLLFRRLFHENPAPFFAYLNCGNFTVLSTSPERFIFRKKNYIETRPIKGTRPRGKTPVEDRAMMRELIESSKEEAELSMIVDLLRNDLGRVCIPGTVKVREHKRVEAYQNVFHLVSIVEGRLPKGYKQMEILKALFPGGSITGCPKIRAMEIIEELETVKRKIYTGAIGYVSLHETMDLSIAIRTAVRKENTLYLSVGGGIVYPSIPEDEYMETIHKGDTFLRLLCFDNKEVGSMSTTGAHGFEHDGFARRGK